MKSWVMPATIFFLGLGLGLSGPLVATRYLTPYMPDVFQPRHHPLEGIVTHKQREHDRLLMTVTTTNGTILTTFRKQVPEIALLVNEQDSITLDVKQYKPFVNDPTILKVNKHIPEVHTTNPMPDSPPPTNEPEGLIDPQRKAPPLQDEIPAPVESAPSTTD